MVDFSQKGYIKLNKSCIILIGYVDFLCNIIKTLKKGRNKKHLEGERTNGHGSISSKMDITSSEKDKR
jgi:hypothetical protein